MGKSHFKTHERAASTCVNSRRMQLSINKKAPRKLQKRFCTMQILSSSLKLFFVLLTSKKYFIFLRIFQGKLLTWLKAESETANDIQRHIFALCLNLKQIDNKFMSWQLVWRCLALRNREILTDYLNFSLLYFCIDGIHDILDNFFKNFKKKIILKFF